MSIKLLIADDHEVVRSGLKSLMAGSDIKVVAEAATGEAAVKMAIKLEPDVVLLDIRMPDMDGLNALGRIKLERPNLPVLILSTYDNPTYVARVLQAGAKGYVSKSAPPDQLLEAIRRVAAGHNYIEHEIAQELWGNVAVTQAYLTLSEVLGHLDLLLNDGRATELDTGGVSRFRAT